MLETATVVRGLILEQQPDIVNAGQWKFPHRCFHGAGRFVQQPLDLSDRPLALSAVALTRSSTRFHASSVGEGVQGLLDLNQAGPTQWDTRA